MCYSFKINTHCVIALTLTNVFEKLFIISTMMPLIWLNSWVVKLLDPSKRKTTSTAFCWHPGETGLGNVRNNLVIWSQLRHANTDADQFYFGMQVWRWEVRFSVPVLSCSRCHSDRSLENLHCYPEPETKPKQHSTHYTKFKWLGFQPSESFVAFLRWIPNIWHSPL